MKPIAFNIPNYFNLTQFQISKEEKEKMEHEAVHSILKGLLDGIKLKNYF